MILKPIYFIALLIPSFGYCLDNIDIYLANEHLTSRSFMNELTQLKKKKPDVIFAVHNIELTKNIEDRLSENLPTNEDAAMLEAQRRMSEPEYRDAIKSFEMGMNNYLSAIEYNITSLPAVMFDKKFIVYGETPSKSYQQYVKYTK